MGLLDSILGGIAGNALGRSRMGGGARNNILMALLPIVLGMLANRKGGSALGSGGVGGLGGLGGLAGLGGLGAILAQLQQHGFADQVQSWIGTGQNQPIPPDALSQVLDPDQLSQIASQAGITEDEARSGLSQLLPDVVDHFTPQGQVPDFDQLAASVDQFEQQLQGGGE